MPEAATQHRWERRLLLLALVIGGLWLVGLLGHTGQAHADPLAPPTRPASSAPLARPSDPIVSAVRTAQPAASMIVEKTVSQTIASVVRPVVQPLVTNVVEPVVQPLVTNVVEPVVQPLVTKILQPTLGRLQPVLGSTNPASPVLGSTNPASPVLGSTDPVSAPTSHAAMHTTAMQPTTTQPTTRHAASKQAVVAVRSSAGSNWTPMTTASQTPTVPAFARTATASTISAVVVAGHRPVPAPQPIPSPEPVPAAVSGTATGAHQSSTGIDLVVSHSAPGVALRGQMVAAYSTSAPREQAYRPSVSPD